MDGFMIRFPAQVNQNPNGCLLYIICKTFIITQYAFTQLYFEFAPSIDFVDTPGVMRIAQNTAPMMKQFNADESTTE